MSLILSVGYLSSLLSQIASLVHSAFCYRWLSPENDAHDFPNPSDSGKMSACMNAVSRGRLVPLDAAADAVTSTNLLAMAEDFHPMCFLRTSMVVPSIRWLAALPTHKECRVYRLFPILAAQASRSSAPAPAAGSLSSDF